MKLFLASLAISKSQVPEFIKLVGKPANQIRLALIENAADPEGEVQPSWVVENRVMIQEHGFDVEIIDLRKYKNRRIELRNELAGKDVIWLGGGNAFYLRWLLQDTGADKIITGLVGQGKVYGGGSAGAVVAGPTLKHFEAADDPVDAPEVVLGGLNFTEKVIVPHMDNAKFKHIIESINQKLKVDGYQTVPLKDSQALVVDGEKEKLI